MKYKMSIQKIKEGSDRIFMKTIYEGEEWLGEEPQIKEEDIHEHIVTDVVIVGAGLAGVAAARRAAELGVKIAVFEKCGMVQARSGDFAVMDSAVAKRWGREKIKKTEIVNALMQDMAYKANQNILRR